MLKTPLISAHDDRGTIGPFIQSIEPPQVLAYPRCTGFNSSAYVVCIGVFFKCILMSFQPIRDLFIEPFLVLLQGQ